MWLLSAKILEELTVDTQDGEKRKDKYLEYENQNKKKTKGKKFAGLGK